MAKEERFIMADGCAVRISDTIKGNGVVVLLHGYLESLDVWDDFTLLLSPQQRVFSIDLPGHGVSEIKGDTHTMAFLADTVYAAMQVSGIENAVVVGHSMGGYVALELMRRHPEVVSGLVLFHSTPNADSERKREDRLREIALIEGGKKELIAKSFPHLGFAEQNRRRLSSSIRGLEEQIVMTEDEGIVALLRGIKERDDLNDMMRDSGKAQLLIVGRHDEYIKPEIAEKMIADHPKAEVVWLENSGHMGFVEEPEASAVAILAFAESVQSKK